MTIFLGTRKFKKHVNRAKLVVHTTNFALFQYTFLFDAYDGHANSGITDRTKLSAIAKEYGEMGIGLTMMGVGNGFDEELLESLADHGNGNFYYIEKADDIPDIFAKELEGLCAVVAQNVQVTLTPQEG